MVLESCYPTIYQATDDRMIERFGWLGKLGSPLLICQLRPRLGIGASDLKPIEAVKKISAPKLFIAESADKLTTIQESKDFFNAAAEPKQIWLLDGAGHEDLHTFAKVEYEKRVLAFLSENFK
jgi:fermentation-respiration switch protein FrsA (DUF1100 family)